MAWPALAVGSKLTATAWAAVRDYIDNVAGVSAATASALIRRDASGRAKVADPAAASDIATKGYVDSAGGGGVPAVYFQAQATEPQSILSGSSTPISWGTAGVVFDVVPGGGTMRNLLQQSRIYCPAGQGGVYVVEGRIYYDTNTSGERGATWRLNGTTMLTGSSGGLAPFSGWTVVATTPGFLVTLAPGDYLELIPYQTSGMTIDTTTAPGPACTVRRVF